MKARTPQQECNRAALTGPLVLFDGVCNLCNGSVRFLILRDRTGRLRFAPIQSEAGQAVLRRHKLPLTDWDSFVFLDDGRAYLKAAAFCRIVRYLRWPRRLLGVFGFVPTSMADWLYDRVVQNRYALFGRRQRCVIPSSEDRLKFIL